MCIIQSPFDKAYAGCELAFRLCDWEKRDAAERVTASAITSKYKRKRDGRAILSFGPNPIICFSYSNPIFCNLIIYVYTLTHRPYIFSAQAAVRLPQLFW